MQKPTPKANLESYFENPDRSKDTEMTEVLGLDDNLKEMENKLTDTEPSKNITSMNQKINEILSYREEVYYRQLEKVMQESHVDLTKNVINFCRAKCFDNNYDEINMNEKKCLKNCIYKYKENFKLLSNFQDEYTQKYGNDIYLYEESEREGYQKLLDVVKLGNQMQTTNTNI